MPKIPLHIGSLGVVSDLHNNREHLKKVISWFSTHPVDGIVLAGDTPGYTMRSFTTILNAFLRIGVPVVVFPGSHENSEIYTKTMEKYKDNRLLINAEKKNNRLISYGGWELVIIPGSFVISSGPRKFIGGSYWLFEKNPTISEKRELDEKIRSIGFARHASPVSIEDTQRILDKKSKTSGSKKIVFSHEPIRCKTSKGLDYARFGKPTEEFSIKKKHLRLQAFKDTRKSPERNLSPLHILPLHEVTLLKNLGYPVKILKKHVGGKAINSFLRKNRISKFVCGHIHECSKRAIDKKEKKVKENTPSSQLFLNSGPDTATIIKIKKNKISYYFM